MVWLACFWVTSFSHSVLSTTLACSTCLALDHWLCSRRSASSEVTPSRSVILDTAWDGKQKEAGGLDQGSSKSGTVDLPSDKAWKKMIIIMLFDGTDANQLSENSLLFLFDLTSNYTKNIKSVCPKAFISLWLWERGRNSQIPPNYLFKPNHTHWGYSMCRPFDK